MFPNNDFESEFTFETNAAPMPEDAPFHVLFLGGWRGDALAQELSERRPIVIDRDNFDEVLAKLDVKLELDWQGDVLTLHFAELQDFHPDNLFRNVPIFSELRDIRRRLSASDTFDAAAHEVRSWFTSADSAPGDNVIENDLNDAPPIESENLLDLILTQNSPASAPASSQTTDNTELGRFVSKIVAPHLMKIDENEQSKLIAAVDEIITSAMRSVLHHPKFQALESAWRGLHFVIRRLETDSLLKVFIFDVSKTELTDNLKSVDNLTDTFLYKLLLNNSASPQAESSFAVVGGDFSFGVNVDDIAALMRIGKIAAAAEAPFLSYIQPDLFGIRNFYEISESASVRPLNDASSEKLWSAIRSAEESRYIGLSPLKVFARLPYGEQTDSIDTFDFEELPRDFLPEQILWMNPCFASALLLAQSFQLAGWQMGQYLQHEIERLPLFIYKNNGETRSMPCAEIVLNENLLETMMEYGLMPLVSFRDSDKIRFPSFRAVSTRPGSIRGRW